MKNILKNKESCYKKYIKCRNIIFDVLFCISILVCIGCTIYSTLTFVNSRKKQSSIIENYTMTIVSNTEQTDKDKENMLDYAMQLQEIEAKSTQTDVISFIYAFISGTLIGVASFFIKNSADNTQIIENSKNKINEISEQAVTLEDRAILLEFQTYFILIENAVQNIYLLSLNTAADGTFPDNIQRVQKAYAVKINDYIPEIVDLFNKYELKLSSANDDMKSSLFGRMSITRTEIMKLKEISTKSYSSAVDEWSSELKKILDILHTRPKIKKPSCVPPRYRGR